jgi:predicted dehydrogenase
VTWQIQTYAHRERLVNWKSGAEGGALALFGSHVLHHVERLAGPVARVSCRLTPAAHAAQGGDADVQAILQLVDGGSVAVAIGADSPGGSGHRLELHGDRGSLLLDNPTRDHLRGFRLRFGAREADVAEPRAVPAPPEDRWPRDGRIYAVSRLASRFVDCALGGPVARPDFGDGLRVQALMDAAQRSHATSSWTEPNVDG